MLGYPTSSRFFNPRLRGCEMAKVYYVGDWAVLTGPWFAESPFQNAMKGLDVFNYGTWLKEALESTGIHQVTSVPSWEFYKLGPGAYERILAEYDVIIFSDVEGKLFQLAPSFFDRAKFGQGVLTFPDRVRLTIDAVRQGKGLMLLGGWYSFTGEQGKGG
ncbi:MAG: glutamine amidotransferase, partial [Planctomycetota bacterium]